LFYAAKFNLVFSGLKVPNHRVGEHYY